MAMPYPEGEVFFDRNVLKAPNKKVYDASNIEQFYSHMMIEYIWNEEAYHGAKNAGWNEDTVTIDNSYSHPRSSYRVVRNILWDTYYGVWEDLPFSYGPTPQDIKKRHQHELNVFAPDFVAREKGNAAESFFMYMPMPTMEQRWVWMDLLAHVRAIYIPVAHSASPDHPNLTTWVQVNFAMDRSVPIWRGGEKFEKHEMTKLKGLSISREETIGFDICGLIELLSVPRHFRKGNPYTSKVIKIVPSNTVKTIKTTLTYTHIGDIGWTTIQKAHSGLDLMWKKADDKPWAEDFTKNLIVVGLGFVPGAGPLLSVCFSLAWTAIRDDKEKFWKELSLWVPAVKWTADERAKVEKSFIATQQYVDEKWLTPNSDIRVGSIDKKPSTKVETTLDEADTVLKNSRKTTDGNIDGTSSMSNEGNKILITVPPFDA